MCVFTDTLPTPSAVSSNKISQTLHLYSCFISADSQSDKVTLSFPVVSSYWHIWFIVYDKMFFYASALRSCSTNTTAGRALPPPVSRLPLSICVTSLTGLCAGADVEMCSAAGPKVASWRSIPKKKTHILFRKSHILCPKWKRHQSWLFIWY